MKPQVTYWLGNVTLQNSAQSCNKACSHPVLGVFLNCKFWPTVSDSSGFFSLKKKLGKKEQYLKMWKSALSKPNPATFYFP